MGRTRFAKVFLGGLAFALALNSLTPVKALAQATGPREQTTGAASIESDQAAPGSASENVNGEILQELERMRTRIQELEARLKQKSADATPDAADSGLQTSSES